MIPGTFLKHFLESDNEIIVLEELVDIHGFVVLIFGVVFDHFGLYEVDLMIAVESVEEAVLLECAPE